METALLIRNVLFKAFVINLVVIILVWLLSLTGIYTVLMERYFAFNAMQTTMYLAVLISFWKILNVVFFLVPAIAIHWECCRKR